MGSVGIRVTNEWTILWESTVAVEHWQDSQRQVIVLRDSLVGKT